MKRAKRESKRVEVSGLTLEISAPLAHRPGVLLVRVKGRERLEHALPVSLGPAGFTKVINIDCRPLSPDEMQTIYQPVERETQPEDAPDYYLMKEEKQEESDAEDRLRRAKALADDVWRRRVDHLRDHRGAVRFPEEDEWQEAQDLEAEALRERNRLQQRNARLNQARRAAATRSAAPSLEDRLRSKEGS